jgi:hypothetical protein
MLNQNGNLKSHHNLIALFIGTICAVFIGSSWSGQGADLWFGLIVGFVFGYISTIAMIFIGIFVENALKTDIMRQKLTEDEYYRMEARKKMDREGK